MAADSRGTPIVVVQSIEDGNLDEPSLPRPDWRNPIPAGILCPISGHCCASEILSLSQHRLGCVEVRSPGFSILRPSLPPQLSTPASAGRKAEACQSMNWQAAIAVAMGWPRRNHNLPTIS